MRVALVTPRFAVKDAYGGEVSVGLLADELTRRGHDVRVLADRVDGEDARVRRTPMTPRDLAAGMAGADVVHVYNMDALAPAWSAARRAGVPAVITANSYWATCLFGDMSFPDGEVCPGCHLAGIRRDYATRNPAEIGRRAPAVVGRAVVAARTRALARYGHVIVLSEASRHQLARGGVPADRMTAIPNMAEPAMLAAAPTPIPEEPVVLFVGALKRAKGAHILLDALPLVRERVAGARVVIAGDGPERGALAEQAARLGLAGVVEFAGRVPPERLAALYRSARAVAFPVLWVEPGGRVTLEAWAAGRPLVASDRGGPGEAVEDGVSGLAPPAGDARALADALARVLADRALAERLAAGGRAALARHAPDAVVPRILGVYEAARKAI